MQLGVANPCGNLINWPHLLLDDTVSARTDKRWRAKCRAMDGRAWDALLAAHHERVARFVFLLEPGATVEWVEAVCRQTFLRAVDTFRDPDLDQKVPPGLLLLQLAQEEVRQAGGAAGTRPDGEGAELRRMLDGAGGPCRSLIEMWYFTELSQEELAVAFDVNRNTVPTRLSKCLDRVQSLAAKPEEARR